MSTKKPATRLKLFSEEELREGQKFQQENYGWDFSSEREFIENLFMQRFNFLLIFYSLFVAAATSASTQGMLIGVLIAGSVLCFLVWLVIWRAFVKFKIAITICYRLEKHVLVYQDKEAESLPRIVRLFPVNSIIGFWIPCFCFLSMGIATYLACQGVLSASP